MFLVDWLNAYNNIGGDLTAFIVERKDNTGPVTVDVLMSGNGQYGGLGNNIYTTAQGDAARVKGLSGLLQCDSIFEIYKLDTNARCR